MIHLQLIGIGTGNPDHLTRAAAKAMAASNLILLPRKDDRTADLIDLRRMICAEAVTGTTRVEAFDLPARSATPDYLGDVDDWHDAISEVWAREIGVHLPGGGTVSLLIWGDPSLYDSSLRIAERLRAGGMMLEVSVVPGITSIQALTAAHAVPLNALAAPVMITTGRRLRETGWPADADSVVVMLDAGCAFETLVSNEIEIWWGAYLGLPHEALIHGMLGDVANLIAERRVTLRADHGWIMDIYLMRRPHLSGTGSRLRDRAASARLASPSAILSR